MQNNPFCLSFGKEPDRFVERAEVYSRITDSIQSESPSNYTYLITGVRGSGKTVLMATIANKFREDEDWAVISLNSGRNLLEMMAAGLYEEQKLRKYFLKHRLIFQNSGLDWT